MFSSAFIVLSAMLFYTAFLKHVTKSGHSTPAETLAMLTTVEFSLLSYNPFFLYLYIEI